MKKIPIFLALATLLLACGIDEARPPTLSSAPSPVPPAESTLLPGLAPSTLTPQANASAALVVENVAPGVTPTAATSVATPTATPTSSSRPTPAVALSPPWQVLVELGDTFTHLAAAASGDVWAAGTGGLYRFDAQGWQVFPLPDGLGEGDLSAGSRGPSMYGLSDLAIAPSGAVWIGTVGQGVYQFENGTWTHYTAADGLPGNGVRSLGVDAQNHLWAIGPDSLSRYDGQTWQLLPIGESQRMAQELADLAVTPAGQVWLSVPTDGLYQFDGESWTRHSQETRDDWDGIVAEVSMHVAASPSGQVWLGTDGGWLRWSEQGWQGLELSIPAPFAYPLAADSTGGAWGRVAPNCYFCRLPDFNEQGAVYVSPDVACRFTAADGLGSAPLDPPPAFDDYETPRPDEVWDIAVAADSSVWFITQGYITVFRPQEPVCSYASPQAVRTRQSP